MFKEKLIEEIRGLFPQSGAHLKFLELGSGQSKAIIPLLKRESALSYVGIEPSTADYETAKENLKSFPNALLIHSLAYDIASKEPADVCFSLSVLEHVKNLEKFIEQSVKSVRKDGYIVHSYDLGHALHPSSFKERFQVWLGGHLPFLLPEHKFVRYVSPEEVIKLLEKNGASLIKVTYHQMPNHKALIKKLSPLSQGDNIFVDALMKWEFDISPSLQKLRQKDREKLFPTVCVWAKRS